MRKLVFGFRAILRGGKVTTLHRWMEQARKTGIHSLVRFVRTLKQDLSAVEAAVSEPWSNGPVEGQLNRLKMLKRQMYGRAGIEPLRARLIPEPAFLVTHNFAPKLRQNRFSAVLLSRPQQEQISRFY
jgi:transposase